MDKRRDALAGAAKLALEIREIAATTGDGAVCTSGGVVCKPGIVTSVVETAEQLLDQRHLDAERLASMLEQAKEASERFASEERIEVEFERIWSIEPILFDETLIGFCDEAILEVAGTAHRLPSGPLHDAAEVSRAGVPDGDDVRAEPPRASRTRSSRTRRRSTSSSRSRRSIASLRRPSAGSRTAVVVRTTGRFAPRRIRAADDLSW